MAFVGSEKFFKNYITLQYNLMTYYHLLQWRKSWGGQGGTVPSKVLTGGTAVLTVPPKVQASEGHCWVLLPEISKRVYHIL